MTQFGGDSYFEGQVREAWACYDGKSKTFTPETFQDSDRHGYRVEKGYTLFGAADLHQLAPGVSWKDLAAYIKVDEIVDERGQRQQGVLLPEEAPIRVVMYREGYTQFDKLIHSADRQLRSSQGEEVASWYRKDLEKINPTPMVPRSSSNTLETLKNAIKKLKEAKSAAAEEAALHSVQAAPEKPAEIEEPPEDEIDEVLEESGLTAPSHSRLGKAAKAKAKSKSKLKKEGRGKTDTERMKLKMKRTATAASMSCRGSEAGESLGGGQSVASFDTTGGATAKSGGSTAQSTDVTLERWMKDLCLEKLLSGKALGLKLHHAKNALGGMRSSSGGEANVAYVLLKGHIELFSQAQNLLPDRIEKTNAAQRKRILSDLQIANVRVPLYTAATLFSRCVTEQPDALKKVEMMTLKPKIGNAKEASKSEELTFDCENPTLQGLWEDGLGDTEVGNCGWGEKPKTT